MAEVKVIDATEQVFDRHYLMIVYDDHGMVVDADKGATEIFALDDGELAGTDREAAILDGAVRAADRLNIPVVYVVDYSHWQPGDPLPLPN
jgi:hypothetical protein